MIEIQCNASPFVFKPILQLLDQINFKPTSVREGVILNFLDPFNTEFNSFKQESHLTDAQTKDEQIRYLGSVESQSKMSHLAYALGKILSDEQIIFKISPYFEEHKLLNLFIKYLKQQTNCTILYSFESNEGEPYIQCETTQKLEEIFYASEAKKIENGPEIFDAALTCINAGDYYSAINLLQSIRDLDHGDDYFKTDILCHLAIAHGAIGELKTAVFYWNYVFKNESLNFKNRSSYALGLMYLRHLPKQFQDQELGAKYLNDMFDLLNAAEVTDETRRELDLVFNRNGYALAAFKQGNVDEAEKLVADGIATLDRIGSSLSMFHQSVLYYNLAQCHKAKGEINKVEKTLEKLIEIDERFCLYHQYLIEFYLENNMLAEALEAVETGFKVDQDHVPFHFLKGKIYLLLENEDEALKSLERANELDPLDTSTLAYLTSIYNSQENYQRVFDCLKNFHFKFSNDNNGELIMNNLIIALINASEDENSVERTIEECLNLKPESDFFNEINNLLKEEHVD